ncbi:MAG: hypothetical protein JW981_05720 [Anaerolineae bacterium]|nr:hypothetical protein [Anaerolineae bacterium]
MKTNRFLIGILLVGVILGLITGCKGNKDTEGEENDTQIAIAIALTQTAAAIAPPTTPAPTFTPAQILTPPTPTPDVTNTPGAQGCTNNYTFIADVTIPDGTSINPGKSFIKTWRVKNSGTCTWDSTYQWVFSKGTQMNGNSTIPIEGTVAPGAEYQFSVNLVAPTAAGKHSGEWRITDNSGAPFGLVTVNIEVPGTPTPTPSASIAFNATKTSIMVGECTTLTWKVENVRAVYFQGKGVPGEGHEKVCPTKTTTYKLDIERLDGWKEGKQLIIEVKTSENLPEINYFRASKETIVSKEEIEISWSVQGEVDKVTLDGNEVPLSGYKFYSPVTDTTYTLKATGPGGSISQDLKISVITAPSETKGNAVLEAKANEDKDESYLALDGGNDIQFAIRTSPTAPPNYVLLPIAGNNVRIADMGATEPGYSGCYATAYNNTEVIIFGQARMDLSEDTDIYLCVKTDKGKYAQLRIADLEINDSDESAILSLDYSYW